MKLKSVAAVSLILLVVIGGIIGVRKYESERAARIAAELELVVTKRLNDSTTARLAITEVNKETLAAALTASNKLNGTLQAALRIRVPARDTVIQHDLVPVLGADSTRTATFKDSTFAGTIEATVVAPPCCANLGVSYTLHRPEFSPTVAFTKVSNRIVASVTWAGEHVEIESPYSVLPPVKPKTVGYWVAGKYDPIHAKWRGEGGVLLRLPWLLRLEAGIETTENAFIGIRKEF